MADVEKCFICEQLLGSDAVEVKERGVKTFQISSKKRKDGKEEFLKGRTSVRVHEACRKSYNNEKLIAAFLRKGGSTSTPKSTFYLRSTVPTFEFKKECFLCAEEITKEFLKKQKKMKLTERDIVYEVRKISMKATILEIASKRNDDWGRQIIDRVNQAVDLVAVEARYHNSCMKKLYAPPRAGQKRGGQPSSDVDQAMQYIYEYLEDNADECQFTIEELMAQIQCEYRPDIRTIKSRLLDKYGDDIIVVNVGKKSSPIICFRNTGYKILSDTWYAERKSNQEEDRLRVVKEAAAIILEDIRSQVYETKHYPPSDNFLQDVKTVVPESLNILPRECDNE